MSGAVSRVGIRLPLLVASFALTAYAGIRLLDGDVWGVLVWFVGAALLHDLVLVPLYAAADRAARWACARRRGCRAPGRVNFVRVPAFVSALLLLVWFPLILRHSPAYERATTLPIDVFLGRWLLITAALFAASALWYAVTARRRAPRAEGAP